MSEVEAMMRKKYGKAPPKGGALARLNGGERKFFDSADHALSREGVGGVSTGDVHATVENIPKKDSLPKHTHLNPENSPTKDDGAKENEN